MFNVANPFPPDSTSSDSEHEATETCEPRRPRRLEISLIYAGGERIDWLAAAAEQWRARPLTTPQTNRIPITLQIVALYARPGAQMAREVWGRD
jgi:hypothetical protein